MDRKYDYKYRNLDHVGDEEGEKGRYQFGIYFSVMSEFFEKSTKEQLALKDFDFSTIGIESPERIHQRFKPFWQQERDKPNPSLTSALLRFSRGAIFRAVGFAVLSELLFLSSVLLLPYFIDYFFDASIPFWYGIVYVCVLLMSTGLGYVSSVQTSMNSIVVSREIACAVFGSFYDKVLRSPPGKLNSGELVPHLITFSDELVKNMAKLCFTLVSFPKLLICMIALGVYLKVTVVSTAIIVLMGLVLIFVFVGIADKGSKELSALRKLSGARESELFSKIKTIKMLHWEEYFRDRLSPLSHKKFESHIFHFKLMLHVVYILGVDTILLSEAILFILSFNSLSPVTILTIFGIFVHIAVSYRFLLFPPWMLMFLKGFVDSIQTFLEGEEAKLSDSSLEPGRVVFDKVNLSWKEKIVLSDITMDIHPGHFIILIGGVGSGKSTFLQSLISPQSISAGKVVTGGRIGLVSQPWIPHGTIRENIALNNKLLNENFYWQVINAVDLEEE
eukprot:TRINITY_DN13454_c0_g1_i2.p1 TRINITY_DN13454_c0_g1~~TRINITY_DN13454_c0_g1_i2.p1  ORF type:complete len:504 (-),score=102.92 TRINITY_DN13454_c0_g1_i2:877-2388(-)